MFLPGIAEGLTVIADSILVSVILSRFGFYALRTFGAWLGLTLALSVSLGIVFAALLDIVPASSAPLALATALVALLGLLCVRAIVIRAMSRSSTFRSNPEIPLGWVRAILVSVCGIAGGIAAGVLFNVAVAGPSSIHTVGRT